MLDARLRRIIDSPLNSMAARIAEREITANQITWAGFMVGLLVIPAVFFGWHLIALCLLLLNRLSDGLDGAVARQLGPTDLGGYLDIVLDFIFYSAVVFAFCLAQPEHAVYGAYLIFSFIGTGASFLAFAIMAEKRGVETSAQGKKAIYYLEGIAEGFETILALSLMCLLPGHFWLIALVFGSICWVSTAARITSATKALR